MSSKPASPRHVLGGNRTSIASRVSTMSPAASGQLPRDYALGKSKSRRYEGVPQRGANPPPSLATEPAKDRAVLRPEGDLQAPLLSGSPEEAAGISEACSSPTAGPSTSGNRVCKYQPGLYGLLWQPWGGVPQFA